MNLDKFAPHVSRMLQGLIDYRYSSELWNEMGIFEGEFEVIEPKSGGCYVGESAPPLYDRFKLKIPFAGHSVTWTFIFQANFEEYPPDFMLHDESFEVDLNNFQSLACWDSNNPKSLLFIIKDLLREFKRYQMSLLAKHLFGKLYQEYKHLMISLPELSLNETHVEIFCNPKGDDSFHLLVKLPIDFTVPIYHFDKDYGGCVVLLFMRFTSSRICNSCLKISQGASTIMSSMECPEPSIPAYDVSAEDNLFEYVTLVSSLVNELITTAMDVIEQRKRYISALQLRFRTCILECDRTNYKCITFLFDLKGFSFQLRILLPDAFPKDQPIMTFSSIYHVERDVASKPISLVHKIPFSPRWTPFEMAQRTWLFIVEKADAFKLEHQKSM